MSFSAWLQLANTLLRIVNAAPPLLKSAEAFWSDVQQHEPAPPAVQAGVQAAFHKMREGEVG